MRKGTIKDVLTKCMKMAEKNTMVVIVNVSGFNEISMEEAKEVIKEVTGGVVEKSL